jgi:glycyl-tRNA synthetase
MTSEDLAKMLCDISCPACGTKMGPVNVFDFNLMFETSIGPGSQRKGYLRPETAQGMFTDFGRLLRFYRDKLPFGAVQIGKAYRNEISPRQGMIRLREFTQAEAEIFVHPHQKNHPRFHRYATYEIPLFTGDQQKEGKSAEQLSMGIAVRTGIITNEYVAYYIALTHELLVKIGVDKNKIRFRQHLYNERAHYASDCWDAEIYSDRFGWIEVVGIADRTDYDLNAHAQYSGTSFTVFIPYDTPKLVQRKRIIPKMGLLGPKFRDKAKEVAEELMKAIPRRDGIEVEIRGERVLITPDLYDIRDEIAEVRGEEITPHVIEPSYGIDRMMYAVLEHCYGEEIVEGEVRRILHLPPWVAPVQVAVFPSCHVMVLIQSPETLLETS